MAHIAVFGATGNIGRQIVREAVGRGHDVTAVVRNPNDLAVHEPRLQVVRGNVLDPASVMAAVAGHDAVISAVGPRVGEDPQMLVDAAGSLLQGLKQAHVPRLLVVGGAGSLEVAPGRRLMDTPEFPEAWKPVAEAGFEALELYRADEDIEWTYISPAGYIGEGPRQGRYRTAGEQLVVDEQGESFITIDDYASVVLDELEHPQHIRKRFTAAY